MTRDDARRRLAKITGVKPKELRLDVAEGISSPEKRQEVSEQWERVKAELETIHAEYSRIVSEHQELQRLAARSKELRPIKERLNWARFAYRFEAMKPSGGVGWMVLGKGDTWEEVLTRAEEHEQREKEERAQWMATRKAGA